jgi:hypothetical protein
LEKPFTLLRVEPRPALHGALKHRSVRGISRPFKTETNPKVGTGSSGK